MTWHRAWTKKKYNLLLRLKWSNSKRPLPEELEEFGNDWVVLQSTINPNAISSRAGHDIDRTCYAAYGKGMTGDVHLFHRNDEGELVEQFDYQMMSPAQFHRYLVTLRFKEALIELAVEPQSDGNDVFTVDVFEESELVIGGRFTTVAFMMSEGSYTFIPHIEDELVQVLIGTVDRNGQTMQGEHPFDSPWARKSPSDTLRVLSWLLERQ